MRPSLLAALLPLVACTTKGDEAACDPDALYPLASTAAPNFELEDVNSTSTSYGEYVAPSDHLERVSAWYFGHST